MFYLVFLQQRILNKYFLENHIKDGKINSTEQKEIQKIINIFKKESVEQSIKSIAKKMAEFSNNAVIVAFSDSNIYYTGISNLFSQPEFKQTEMVYNISLIIDHLEQVVSDIFEDISQTQVLIGSENPFGQDCSSVIGRWQLNKQTGLLGILGPIRMDYEKNLGLINLVTSNK